MSDYWAGYSVVDNLMLVSVARANCMDVDTTIGSSSVMIMVSTFAAVSVSLMLSASLSFLASLHTNDRLCYYFGAMA